MKIGRFFVTLVLILGMAGIVTGKTFLSSRTNDFKATLVDEGNTKIRETQALMSELKNRYGISLAGESKPFNWQRLKKSQRNEISANLSKILQLVYRVLEIDAQRLITIDHREVLTSARDNAQSLQRELESFELMYGQNFEPRGERRTGSLSSVDLGTQPLPN